MCLQDEKALSYFGGRWFLFFFIFVDLLTILVIVVGNSFIIFAILLPRRHRTKSSAFFKNIPSRFVLSLCVADLVVGITLIYYLSFSHIPAVTEALGYRKYACISRAVLMVQAHMTAGYSLVPIALDRYFAVLYPLIYKKAINSRNSTLLITAVWLHAIVVTSLLFYHNNWSPSRKCQDQLLIPSTFHLYAPAFSHLFVVAFLAGVHFRIHLEIVASDRRQQNIKSSVSTIASAVQDKSARVLIVVIVCYVLCWTPFTVVVLVSKYTAYKGVAMDVLCRVTFSLANFSFVINPFLYSWKTVAVKEAIRRVLGQCKIGKRDSVTASRCEGLPKLAGTFV
uniref:G-protein coupled receptors family 1 profile domain-containing protein n=1 Tax=Timema douglasi TaxID=61478 RepID=A0A7R8VE42_TIMDO|nr:unnamed protein product [Timema douglasi]